MTPRIALAALVATAPLVVACQPANKPLSPTFGNAVQHNMAVHIINPAPDYGPDGGRLEHSGARMGLAVSRYQTGTEKEPEPVETSEFGD